MIHLMFNVSNQKEELVSTSSFNVCVNQNEKFVGTSSLEIWNQKEELG